MSASVTLFTVYHRIVLGFVFILKYTIYESKQASLFPKNNIMTILIQNINNTMAGYQKEILPSSWSPIVKYTVIILTLRRKKR